jgi:hypothetical protein
MAGSSRMEGLLSEGPAVELAPFEWESARAANPQGAFYSTAPPLDPHHPLLLLQHTLASRCKQSSHVVTSGPDLSASVDTGCCWSVVCSGGSTAAAASASAGQRQRQQQQRRPPVPDPRRESLRERLPRARRPAEHSSVSPPFSSPTFLAAREIRIAQRLARATVSGEACLLVRRPTSLGRVTGARSAARLAVGVRTHSHCLLQASTSLALRRHGRRCPALSGRMPTLQSWSAGLGGRMTAGEAGGWVLEPEPRVLVDFRRFIDLPRASPLPSALPSHLALSAFAALCR